MANEKESVEQTVRNLQRKSRKQYSSEEKIRIVLDGLRGEMKTSLSYAVGKASANRYTISGSNFWKPEHDVWLDTR
jgi:hypothetical protein